MRRLFPALLLFAAWTLPAQDGDETPYFAVSTDRPVRPGETATVRVQAWNVDRLQFRLYRVSEPVSFFEKLENPHQFGGQMRRAPRELTWLERFHGWKRSSRARLRDVARAQFTPENRASLRKSMAEAERKPVASGQAADYAAVPVLNPQQLVRVWEQPVKGARRWDSVNVPLDLPERGVYVLEATDGKRMAYTVVAVSNLAVLTKAVPGKLLVRVVDRVSGEGVENCPIVVWDKASQKALVRERTGPDGVLESAWTATAAESVLVLARTRDDFAASTLWAGGLSSNPDRNTTGTVYTDRPVYRPGHTVHFKAILRTLTGAEYLLPKTPQVQIAIEDPEGQSVYRSQLPLSPTGTLKGEFVLPETAALGYYSLRTGEEGRGVYGGFQVEEYRKPEYEVRVRPTVKRVNQGTAAKVEIEARYYYGEPVGSAKVTYVVHRMRYWRPWDMEDAGDEEGGDQFYGAEQILEQSGTLDAQGKLNVEIPTERGEFDATYRVEARVTDASQREISGSGAFIATQGPFFVDVRPDKYVYSPGDRVALVVAGQDYDGKPAAGIEVRIEVSPHSWDQKPVAVLQTVTTRLDGEGKGKVEVPAPNSGSYTVRATATTADGGRVTDTAWLWVTGDAVSWGGREERIQIVPDKKSYRPGETARVLVVSGRRNADLWITSEGRTLYSSRLVKASGNSTLVDVPVTSAHQPNFYIDVAFVQDNKLYRGSKSVKVPPLEKTLQVEVKTARPEYQPGEPATFRVSTRDFQSRPVAAEVSLGIVDEAIYAIRRESQADLVQVFYGRAYNRVQTESSFYYSFFGEAGTRRLQLARLRPPLARGQLKPERMVTPKIRKAFPDTLYWLADLRTGADGRAEVKVEFPDALTTWRATAKAVTADTRVGGAVNKTIVRKNIVLTLATPRFLTEGDQVTVPAIVRNYLANEKTVKVTLEAKGAEVLEGAPREVKVASRGEARVDFRLRVLRGEKVTLLGQALTDQESDALELPLPVYPVGVRQTVSRAGSLRGTAGPTRFSLEPPKNGASHTRALEIVLAPSVAGSIFAALEYLTSYPYGCVEQTMSSFLPNVIVTQAMKDLALKTPLSEAELLRKTRAGLDRLYGMQHEDGGWGWWTWDETHPFMTAYVTSGLAQAKEAGYKVREDVLERARKALAGQIGTGAQSNADLLAYQVYALALAGGEARRGFDAAWNLRSSMTGYGLGLVGLAARKLGDARADEAAGMLEGRVRQEGDEAWWPADRDALLDFPVDASPEATAFALRFLAAQRPQSALLEKVALWLVNHRDEGYYWISTKQTAMVVFGLTEYLKHSDEMKPEFTATVTVNGKTVANKRFDGVDSPPFRFRVAAAQLAESNAVEITKAGGGRLYWSAQASAIVDAADGLRTGNSALNLARDYFRLAPVEERGHVLYNMTPLNGPANPGDLLAVRLTLSGEGRYLMIEDPLPAGAEPVTRDEGYELKDRPPWWQTWSDRRELRDNRAVYFERIVGSRETKQFTYLLKVTNAGQFSISPARVLPMYQPQVMTATPSRRIEVQPR